MHKLLVILMSVGLMIGVAGCGLKAGINDNIRTTTQQIEELKNQQEALVAANFDLETKAEKLDTEQKGLVNTIATLNTTIKALEGDISVMKSEQRIQADKIGKIGNAGMFAGGGPYLLVIAIILAVLPVAAILAAFYIWLKSKRGWTAFSLLRQAHENIAAKEEGSSLPSEVLAEFARLGRNQTWMRKNPNIADLLEDSDD